MLSHSVAEFLSDFNRAGIPVFLALNERVIEELQPKELAQLTAEQFRRYGIVGLALLYVTLPVGDLDRILPIFAVRGRTFF